MKLYENENILRNIKKLKLYMKLKNIKKLYIKYKISIKI